MPISPQKEEDRKGISLLEKKGHSTIKKTELKDGGDTWKRGGGSLPTFLNGKGSQLLKGETRGSQSLVNEKEKGGGH